METTENRAARRRSGRISGTAVWAGTVATAGWAAVRVAGLERGVPTVQLMAFTPYAAAGSIVPLVAALATRRWGAALLAAGATATLAASVLPRAVARPSVRVGSGQEDAGRPLRVMTANLLHGEADPVALVRLVRREGVDLLAMQEYTAPAEDGLLDAGLDAVLPYRVTHPAPRGFGSALYSRFPLTEDGWAQAATGFGQTRARVDVPMAGAVVVTSVHLSSPADRARTRNWAADLADPAGLTSAGSAQPTQSTRPTGSTQPTGSTPPTDSTRRADAAGPVRLLLGDFNATLDHALLRALLRDGYHDAADAAGAGLLPTWPYLRWYVPRVTLDHVLVDTRVRVGQVTAHDLPGSDHRALIAHLTVPASQPAAQTSDRSAPAHS